MGGFFADIGADNRVSRFVFGNISSAVGAGFLATAAANAALVVMHGNAVSGFEHRLRLHGTRLDTRCICTVIAEYRDRGKTRVREFSLFLVNKVGPVESLTIGACLRIIFGFAGQGTGAATDTLLQVNDHSVLF